MEQQKFNRSLFGYNKKEVDHYIEQVNAQLDDLNTRIVSLGDEKEALAKQNSLLTHRVNINEKTNEEIARLALKEASDLIEKAKRNANMILKESLDYVRTLNNEVEGYKDQAIAFRANVEKMSQDLLDTIDQSEVFYLIHESNKENKE